jgi:predicted amidohydrolase YtcJ
MLNRIASLLLIFSLSTSFMVIGQQVSQAELGSGITQYTNLKGYTLDGEGKLHEFSSFVVEKDKIIAVGNHPDHITDNIQIEHTVDLDGKTVLPGLIDAHGHILGLGANLLEVDLRGTKSEEEAAQRVMTFVSQHKSSVSEDTWIIGRGWNQVLWPTKSFPSKASLDKLLPNTPVWLSRVDGHAGWGNSKALEIAGVDANTLSPSGGEIVKDENGQPTGVFIDNAEYLVTKFIPPTNKQQLNEQLSASMSHLVSLGITSAHDAGISKAVRNLYIEKAENKALDVRIYAMLSATDPDIKEMLEFGHYSDSQDFLSIRSVKAYGDGALGSRGAALIKPYSDDPHNSGLLVTPQETLPTLFNTVLGANFQLNFHAIGDRANRLALQQFARSFKNFPENTQRHRIEHAQVVAVEDIPLFKEYGVIPSMQPTHATSDMNMAEDRIGKERLKGAYAWQTFLKHGSRIAFGSDFPVELANPFHGLHAAITRQNAIEEPQQGWIPSERVTRVQALKGFTIDAAYSGFQEEILGSIEVGKKADFIVLDRDYFKVKEPLIRDTEVIATYVNGKRVYSKPL